MRMVVRAMPKEMRMNQEAGGDLTLVKGGAKLPVRWVVAVAGMAKYGVRTYTWIRAK